MIDDRCIQEKNKKIFATRPEAEEFEKRNRETFGNQQQYAYDCPHGDHFHLASSPGYVEGAPRIKSTDWSGAKAGWQVVDPVLPTSQNDKIRMLLNRYNGTKTAGEIAEELGITGTNPAQPVYVLARGENLPLKYVAARTGGPKSTPVLNTLAAIETEEERLLAQLKVVQERKEAAKRAEEEKRRVTVKVASNGNNSTTMIFASACGNALWLTAEQADSLLARLPGVIEEMKSRQEAAGAVAGQ